MAKKQMCVCRIERVAGDGGGLGAEIKRKYSDGRDFSPGNVSKERSHLNRQVVGKGDPSMTGGNYIASAIRRRIEGANLGRKVGSNQCRAMVVYLSGTHEQMTELVEQGRIDEWCHANVEWLNKTFGKDNVVSVDLHMDEYTPHLHAVVVPITSAPRVRRAREGEAKYKTSPAKNRLCTDEFMCKAKLKEYQDTYAETMSRFGLDRGVRGSTARHQSMNEYYRTLRDEKIPEAEQSLAQADQRLSDVENEVAKKQEISAKLDDDHKRKKKKIDDEKGSALLRGAAALFGKSVDDIAKQKDEVIKDKNELIKQLQAEKKDIQSRLNEVKAKLNEKDLLNEQYEQKLLTEAKQLRAEKLALNAEIKRLQAVVNGEPQRIAEATASALTKGRAEGRSEALKEAAVYMENMKSDLRFLRENNYSLKVKLNEDNNLFVSIGMLLYRSWSDFTTAINAIGGYIRECVDGVNGTHREGLDENEIYSLKKVGQPFNFAKEFARLIALTAAALFGWSEYKTNRAIDEIEAVFDGRYDRIARHLGL